MTPERTDRSWSLALYLAAVTISGAPAFAKHTHHLVLYSAAFAAAVTAIALQLVRLAMAGWLPRAARTLAFALIAAFAAASVSLYPATRRVQPRSSAPDALVEPAIRLVHGSNPYGKLVGTDRVPASPGPGWIVLHAPVAVLGAPAIVAALHLWLLAWTLQRRSATGAPSLVVTVLLLASPAFLQAAFTGQDLLAAGCAVAAVSVGIFSAARRAEREIWIWSVAAGIVATARAPFLILPVALSAILRRSGDRGYLRVFAIGGSVALLIHAVFWAWASHDGVSYQPFHVFDRATRAGSAVVWIVAPVTMAASIWAVMRIHPRASSARQLLAVFATTALPVALVGLVELANRHWDVGGWEGKIYVAFALPILSSAVAVSVDRADRIESA